MIRNSVTAKVAVLLLFGLGLAINTHAQDGCTLLYQYWQQHYPETWQAAEQRWVGISQAEAPRIAQASQQWLATQGFLQARVTILWHPHTIETTCQAGRQYRWASIAPGNLPDSLRAALPRIPIGHQGYDYPQVEQWKEHLVQYYADRGYPFAQVSLDSITWTATHQLAGQWHIVPGLYITYGQLSVDSTVTVNPGKLSQLLGIRIGQPFSKAALAQIPDRVHRIPYLKWQGEPSLYFANQQAHLTLPISYVQASTIDGLLGILPQPGNGPPLLIGQAHLQLWNPLARGSHLALDWQRNQPATQQLQIVGEGYYPLGLPIKAGIHFQLWKQDSAFLKQVWRAEAQSLTLASAAQLGVYSTYRHIAPLNTATDWIPAGVIAVAQAVAGIHLDWTTDSNLKSDWSPVSTANVQLGIGYRQTETLPPGLFGEIKARYTTFIPVQALWGVYTRLDAAWQPRAGLSGGEAYRLGGFQNVRGFNEQSLFAAQYALASMEVRLRTGNESFLAIFTDHVGWVPIEGDTPPRYALGLGLGIQWQLAPGLLRLSWALGAIPGQQPFHWEQSKIHVGILRAF